MLNLSEENKQKIVKFIKKYIEAAIDHTVTNTIYEFNEKVQSMVNQAGPGDQYFFDNVKAKCPGDGAPRNLGALSFKIK